MATVAVLEKLSQSKDQKGAIQKAVGNLDGIELLGNRVLVGIYIEPDKTTGGLYLPTSTVKESVWQGTVGLVLKKGKQAFKDDPDAKVHFHGENVKEGEWVVIRPGDARRVQVNGIDCRMVEDTLIDMVIDNPNCITHR